MIKHYRTLLLVFALFCNTVVIQAQNVSLKLNNVTVKEAIEAVKKQTGKSFFFNVNDVDLNHRVNIDLKDAPLGKALSQILQGQDIDYEVKDNHIVLSKRNSTKNNQTFTVVGQVTDEKGMPLIGVNITAKGHGNTVTDIDGNYSIKAAPGIALVFSYIGYLQESVKVNKQKTVNVQMTESTERSRSHRLRNSEKSQSDRSCRCHIFERNRRPPRFQPRSCPARSRAQPQYHLWIGKTQ